jgi:hypothetical protein
MAAFAAVRTGDWDWAIALFQETYAEVTDTSLRAEAWGNLLTFLTLRGEAPAGALDQVRAFVGDSDEPEMRSNIPWAEYWVAFVAGRYAEASDAAWRFGELIPDTKTAGAVFSARADLLHRDLAAARVRLAEIDERPEHGAAVRGLRATIAAGVAALEGRTADALALDRDALRTWRELRLPWDEAITGLLMATVLDPSEPEVRAAAARARELFVELGAVPFVERLDALLAGPLPGQTVSATP